MTTRTTISQVPPTGGREDLRRQLYWQLQGLTFPAFAECVRLTLEASGYTGVETRRAGSKGKNAGGGWDIEAVINAGLSSGRVLVQLRHSPKLEAVQCRCVDELRGAVMRAGAMEGLLITSGRFSPVAERAAVGCAFPPVRLIDGERLAELMLRHYVGLRRASTDFNDPDRWILDGSFFDTLRRGAEPACAERVSPGITVTITVGPGRQSDAAR